MTDEEEVTSRYPEGDNYIDMSGEDGGIAGNR
jgi:hypothetical protein